VTFNPGVTSQNVTVAVTGDTIQENNETFTVTLSGATNATIADAQGVGTIVNDDGPSQPPPPPPPPPSLSVSDVSQSEGNSGASGFVFSVTLSAASAQPVSVGFATADGSAVAGSDYVATSGSLSFAPGQTSLTVSVPVTGDTQVEPDETFSLVLSGPSGATIARGRGFGTILNDDQPPLPAPPPAPPPSASINDVSVVEGDTGTTNATFTVTLSAPSSEQVSLDFATADGTATAPADYAAASGTVTFAPGETAKTIPIGVKGDTLQEGSEQFFVDLANPARGTIGRGRGVATIVDDDGPPALSVDDIAVVEGNSGTTDAVFTVTLAPASGHAVSVDYATKDGTATAPGDYARTTGSLAFAPGEGAKTITVPVKGDSVHEDNETFTVALTNANGADVAKPIGTGTIVDDDAAPTEQPLSVSPRRTAAPAVRVLGRQLELTRSGYASLQLACPANTRDSCTGSVAVRAVPKRHGNAIAVGSAGFSIPAGTSSFIGVRIARAGRTLVGRRGSLLVRVAILARDGGGTAATVVRDLALTGPQAVPTVVSPGRTARVRHGRLRIELVCADGATGGCRGTLRVLAGRSAAGTAWFALMPGDDHVLGVSLSPAVRLLSARAHRVRVVLVLSGHTASGRGATVRRSLVLLG
jgi:hypothetical protein